MKATTFMCLCAPWILLLPLFAVAQQPSISSFSPKSGPAGCTVTVTGSGFNAVAANNIVWVGPVKATVSASTTTLLTLTIPAGAGNQPITVLNSSNGLSGSSALPFTPTFDGCSPLYSGSFGSRLNFTAGTTTRSVLFADLDRDGKADMIATNTGTATMSVFRNTSVGATIAFATKIDIATGVAGSGASGLATADLDGDGRLDVVTGNYNTQNISVHLNTTVGATISFAAKLDLACQVNPLGIAVGDLDGNGKPDIAVANFSSGSVTVYRNTSTVGAASFVTQTLTGFTGPRELAIADVDGDGKPDLLVADEGASVIAARHNTSVSGTISFSPAITYPTGASPRGLSLGDLNGDGKLDIAVVNLAGASVSVLRNTNTISGTISFATKVDYTAGTSPREVIIGDMDGDGRPDMAAANNTSATVSLFRNTSAGSSISFAGKVDLATGNNALGVALGDLNNDGKLDLAVASSSTGTVGILPNISPTSTLSGIAPAITTGTVCDNSTWKTIYDPVTNGVIASVKDNGNNLGVLSASAYVDVIPGLVNGQRYLARHYVITSSTAPVSAVQVRLYFTNLELLALQAVDMLVGSANDLSITQYMGPGEDGTYNTTGGSTVFIPKSSITAGTAYGGVRYLDFTVNNFSEFWLHGGLIVLPLELSQFTADKKTDGIQLQWTTASEQQTDRFIVERSTDGFSYQSIGSVTTAGNSGENKTYSFKDIQPANGRNYYRLQQVGRDGRSQLSRTVVINWETGNQLTMSLTYPAPRQARATINRPVSNGNLIIYDTRGSQVKQYPVNAAAGTVINIDMNAYSAGIYPYQLVMDKGILKQGKIIVR